MANAAGNPSLKEYIRNDRDQRALEYQEALKRLTDFIEDVQRLAETFSKIPLHSERLHFAKALFDDGKIRDAGAVLKTSEMEMETDALLLNQERLRQRVAENDSLLKVKASDCTIP